MPEVLSFPSGFPKRLLRRENSAWVLRVYPLPLLENEPSGAWKGRVVLIPFVQKKPVSFSYSLPMTEVEGERGNCHLQDSATT